MSNKLLKGTLVVLGASLLSTLGIFASDGIRGISTGISNLASVSNSELCGAGTVSLKHKGALLCVDAYEASPSAKCPQKLPTNLIESEQNASTHGCIASSIANATPWNYISLPQAQRVCATTGKRLPTSDEWYAIALGTNPEQCVIDEKTALVTGSKSCVSAIGAFDVVGNMWEWVDETVVGNIFDGRTLPGGGYVASVDSSGIAITSDPVAQELYGADYFWSKEEGVFGMIRGGYYGSESDAGLYTVNASIPTSFASQGVGFRCVEDKL